MRSPNMFSGFDDAKLWRLTNNPPLVSNQTYSESQISYHARRPRLQLVQYSKNSD